MASGGRSEGSRSRQWTKKNQRTYTGTTYIMIIITLHVFILNSLESYILISHNLIISYKYDSVIFVDEYLK